MSHLLPLPRICRHAWFAAYPILICVICFASHANAFPIENRTNQHIEIWLWSGEANAWSRPPLRLNSMERANVNHGELSEFYIIAKTPDRQTYTVGWIDFAKLLKRAPNARLAIYAQGETQTREVIYTEHVPQQRTRTVTRTVYERRLVNGIWRTVPRQVHEEQTYIVMVPETRTRHINYTVQTYDAVAEDNGGRLMCKVTFKTDLPGAYILYHLAARNNIMKSGIKTNGTEHIPVGVYIIWTERDGGPTATKQRYDLYRVEQEIAVEEDLLAKHDN